MSVLGEFCKEMTSIGVPYEFMRWTGDAQDVYFVGEYSETPTATEDGYKESTILVTGTAKGSWLELERYRAMIENHFPAVYGLRKSTDTGAVVFYYDNSFPVDPGEAELKRIQINIAVKEWKGAM